MVTTEAATRSDKVADLRPATLLKKRPWRKCFSVDFVKFLRTPFLQNTSGRLLLLSLIHTYEADAEAEADADADADASTV